MLLERIAPVEKARRETYRLRPASQHCLARAYWTDGQEEGTMALMQHVVRID